MFIRFILKSKTLSLGDSDTPALLFDGYMFHYIVLELNLSGVYDEEDSVKLQSTHIQAVTSDPAPATVGGRVSLPIDEHKDAILSKVAQDRVVIIHGYI
jgi:HrpA-like RNA helicase